MRNQITYELNREEQIALAESALDCPLNEIEAGSVTAETWTSGQVIVRWQGARIIPLAQLASVVAVVGAEKSTDLENGRQS